MERKKKVILKTGSAWAILVILVSLFVGLADEIKENDTLGIDRGILLFINKTSSPFLDAFMVNITKYGGIYFTALVTLAILLYLLKNKRRFDALFVSLGTGGTLLLNMVLKLIFKRTRPDLWNLLVTEKSYSFPSGHTMITMAFAITVILLFRENKYKIPISILSLIFAILVAFSRLYLGVHYPTDVLGGWIISIFWVLLSYRMVYTEVYE